MGKVFGSAYDISVIIVTPNKVVHEGNKIIGEDTAEESKSTALIELENVEFNYPSKPDVKVLKNVDIEVRQN
jgi:ABC-type multidrug transport system fused ATPase/permease subunit